METPSILSHVSIGVADLNRAAAFYDAVLTSIGARRIHEDRFAIAYGRAFPEFWINAPLDEAPASVGNGTHFAFFATGRDQVQAFWDVALANGAAPDGAPGPRPEYGAPYYGCFMRDPDGHKIEATFWDRQLAEAP